MKHPEIADREERAVMERLDGHDVIHIVRPTGIVAAKALADAGKVRLWTEPCGAGEMLCVKRVAEPMRFAGHPGGRAA